MTVSLALISDSTGDLGERFIKALVSQFPRKSFEYKIYRFIDSKKDLKPALQDLRGSSSIIFHTTIYPDLKREIESFAAKNRLPVFDLTGGAMRFLEKATKLKSKPNPEAVHELDQEYDRRIAALNFTVEHDDGKSDRHLEAADVVLLGVSRTSKTPTSIYLANKGYKVANIPIVRGVPIPDRVWKRPRLRMVGLLINPQKLVDVRRQRAREENIPESDYLRLEAIEKELIEAHNLFLELNIPIIEVTNNSVEETAAMVQKKLGLR